MAMSKLRVQVLSAHDLMPDDQQGSASAFVVLCAGSQRFRTSTKFKDVSPAWNESFYFDMPDHDDLALDASVYGVNKSIQSSRSLLGQFRLNVSPSHTDAQVIYLPLEKGGVFSHETRGYLGLKLNITNEASVGAQETRVAGSTAMRLCVEVVSAQDLKLNDKQATFVELSFDYHQFCTTAKEKDLNPVWNEHVYFDVWDPSSLPTLVLEACVYNFNNSIKGSKSFLGEVKLDSSSFLSYSDGTAASYYPLKKSGIFSRGVSVTGGLRLRAYITNEPSIRSPDPPELHVSSNLEIIQSSRPQPLPLHHLKKITNNFSDERILGHGGFGVVYKGVLQNGEIIAVKKIMPSFTSVMQNQFQNEVYHLMMLKHPNIVQFIGYCFETQNTCLEYNGKHIFAESTERLLCLEYLSNGSLDKYLTDESSGLNWSTRYKIIEGTCYGLCHLHEQVDKPIIHLDLKPANILLDDGMVPKITDFGLSRLLDQQQTMCTSSRVGTLGYMAPEFVNRGTITPKSDIFSLGVIIMEVVTGHRDYPDVTRESSDNYIELALKKWRDVLQRQSVHGSLETDCEQIKRCIQIGLICVDPDRKKRPPITKVISMLQGSDIIECGIINEDV
ncbi:unnamed protein product [Alopecurus aequalis]